MAMALRAAVQAELDRTREMAPRQTEWASGFSDLTWLKATPNPVVTPLAGLADSRADADEGCMATR